jgi:anti-anti-sigma regulatory factor/HAMP domain-containing protein
MNAVWNKLSARLILAFLAVATAAVATVSAIQSQQVSSALLADSNILLHARAEAEARRVGSAIDAQISRLRGIAVGNTLHAAADRQMASYATTDEAEIARQISTSNARWLTAGAGAPVVTGVLNTSLADDLRDQTRIDQNLANLMFTDRYGAMVASSSRTANYSQADEQWWQYASTAGVYVGTPAFDSDSGTFGVTIAIAIRAKDKGDFIGVLRSTYRADAITLPMTENRFGTGTKADLLIDNSILEPGGSQLGTPPADDASAITQARDTPYTLVQYRGSPRLVALASVTNVTQVTNLNWGVILYQNRSDALAPVSEAQTSTIITALLVLMATAFAAVFIAELISAPIRRMTIATEQIAAGNLEQHVGITGGAEIGRLARGFDQMATALKERTAAEQAAQAERALMQQELIEAQDRRIEELATPTIPLGRDTLLLPLIGSVDRRRAEHVLQTVLADVHASRARMLILDLSGVRDVDAEVVAVLMQAAAGVRLIGARVILVGIRAQTARTIVDLNIDLTGIPTYANLQDALNTMTR